MKITKEFRHELDTEDIKLTAEILHFAGTNPAERKKIETEQEAWRSVNAMFEDKEKELTQKLDEKDKVIDEKDKAIDEKDKVIDEKDKVIDEKDKAISTLVKQLEELKRQLDEKKK